MSAVGAGGVLDGLLVGRSCWEGRRGGIGGLVRGGRSEGGGWMGLDVGGISS